MRSSVNQEKDKLISIIYYQARQLISTIIGIEILSSVDAFFTSECNCWINAMNQYRRIVETLSNTNNNMTYLDTIPFLKFLPRELISYLEYWDNCFVYIPKEFKEYVDSKFKIEEKYYKDLWKGKEILNKVFSKHVLQGLKIFYEYLVNLLGQF